jgi:glutamate 5-kinase
MTEIMARQDTQSGREQLAKAKKVVIKVGTSTITHENGRFNLNNLEHLCRSIANQMNQGKEIILVSSGAIGSGSAACT